MNLLYGVWVEADEKSDDGGTLEGIHEPGPEGDEVASAFDRMTLPCCSNVFRHLHGSSQTLSTDQLQSWQGQG